MSKTKTVRRSDGGEFEVVWTDVHELEVGDRFLPGDLTDKPYVQYNASSVREVESLVKNDDWDLRIQFTSLSGKRWHSTVKGQVENAGVWVIRQ